MEASILKEFIRQDVEVLIGGTWVEGHLMPIVKNIVVLLPVGQAKEFYGPTSCKMEVIQAIRQVKRQPAAQVANPVSQNTAPPPAVKSGFDAAPKNNHPGNKFVHR
jgi:hypothetical protein